MTASAAQGLRGSRSRAVMAAAGSRWAMAAKSRRAFSAFWSLGSERSASSASSGEACAHELKAEAKLGSDAPFSSRVATRSAGYCAGWAGAEDAVMSGGAGGPCGDTTTGPEGALLREACHRPRPYPPAKTGTTTAAVMRMRRVGGIG